MIFVCRWPSIVSPWWMGELGNFSLFPQFNYIFSKFYHAFLVQICILAHFWYALLRFTKCLEFSGVWSYSHLSYCFAYVRISSWIKTESICSIYHLNCYSTALVLYILLAIVDYYLKELCNTIIKFKGMLAYYRCFVAPYSLFIMV